MHALILMRNMSDRNRSRFEIVAEILTHLRQPTGKTNLMSQCNMNFAQSRQYLTFMKSNGLIQKDAMAGKTTYQRTETMIKKNAYAHTLICDYAYNIQVEF